MSNPPPTMRLRWLLKRVTRRGFADAELLSVYRDHGVIRKRDRDDNFNKPSDDLSSYLFVRAGDLVLNKMKTWQGSLGVSPYDGIVSPAYFVCAVRADVHGRFLHHLLRSKPLVAEYARRSQGIRPNQWDLPWEQLVDIRIALPEPAVQRQIAEFLDAETAWIDAIIQQRTRQSELLVERQRIACRALVTGGEAVFPMASLRRWWSVIDCKHRTPDYVPVGIPLISTGEVAQGRLALERTQRFVSPEDYEDLAEPPRRPRRGDLIYSRNASLGESAYVDTDEPFCMGQDVCLITSPDQDQHYLSFALDLFARRELEQQQIGSTFKRINVDQIKALSVPHPSPEKQRVIARRCDHIERATTAALDAIDRQITLLRERRQTLITAAVSGHVDVGG